MTIITSERKTEILIKHSGTVNIANVLNGVQRKCWNAMLYQAYPYLQSHHEYSCPLLWIKRDSGYRNKNMNDFKMLIRSMQGAIVEGDIFNKDGEYWRSFQLLGEVAFTNDGYIKWSYSESLRQFLANPKVYARLNMVIQRELSGKYAVPLWECLVDSLGAKRSSATVKISIEDARKILPVEEGQYPDFKDFKRCVIKKAVDELNRSSELTISQVRYKRVGRSVAYIEFDVERKQPKLLNDDDTASVLDVSDFRERLSNEFSCGNKQIEEFITYAKKAAPSDYLGYLVRAMNYALAKKRAGEVTHGAGAYLAGILRKGFNNELSVAAKPIAKMAETTGKRLDAAAYERFNTILDSLTDPELDELKREFVKTASPSDRVSISVGGLESRAPDVMPHFFRWMAENGRRVN